MVRGVKVNTPGTITIFIISRFLSLTGQCMRLNCLTLWPVEVPGVSESTSTVSYRTNSSKRVHLLHTKIYTPGYSFPKPLAHWSWVSGPYLCTHTHRLPVSPLPLLCCWIRSSSYCTDPKYQNNFDPYRHMYIKNENARHRHGTGEPER